MGQKLNYKRTFFIGLAFLSISGFWQMYDTIIPLILQNTFNFKESVTGVIMALDNVIAIFLLPLFGALSDKTDTRFGKRTPFIVTGTAIAAALLIILPIADRTKNVVLFVAALFAILLAMGLYRSPAVALMPDLTPNALRSKANAVINLMGAVGGVYTLIMIKLLVGDGDRPDYMPLFISIAAMMVIAVGILVITIREKSLKARLIESGELNDVLPSTDIPKEEKEAGAQMTPEIKRSFCFMLASIFLWFTAYNAVATAFSRYTRVVWHMEGGSFANCIMVATIAAIASYIPIGHISSKIGRKKTILLGIILMSLCYFSAIFFVEFHSAINILFAILGIGWAAINVNSYPMIVAMGKGYDIGKFTGTYYTFSMAAQIITPIMSGILLENISYMTLFPYALIFSCLAFITMLQVKHGDVKPEKKASVLENFDFDD